MKIPSSNLGRTCCVQKLFLTFRTISVHSMFSPCSEFGIFMYSTCNLINNLSSYCGLVDAKIRASDEDLPVKQIKQYCFQLILTILKVQLTLTFWFGFWPTTYYPTDITYLVLVRTKTSFVWPGQANNRYFLLHPRYYPDHILLPHTYNY